MADPKGYWWHQGANSSTWHRSLVRGGPAVCGGQLQGLGRARYPARGEAVCKRCAKETGYRRRGRSQTTRSHSRGARVVVTLPDSQVDRARAQGLDVVAMLRAGWDREYRIRRQLGVDEARKDARAVERVKAAALELLPRYEERGVPGRELRRATGMRAKELVDVFGVPSKSIRFGDRTHRGWDRDQILALDL